MTDLRKTLQHIERQLGDACFVIGPRHRLWHGLRKLMEDTQAALAEQPPAGKVERVARAIYKAISALCNEFEDQYSDEGPEVLSAARAAIEAMGDGWQRVGDKKPPPHDRYRVCRDEKLFDATPCYGLHHPWWVPRNGFTLAESEPINMHDDDCWRPLPEPPK